MVKLQARTLGKDIIISEDSFEHLLNCLANQKYMPCENLGETESENQATIDDFWRQGMDFLSKGVVASSKVEEPVHEEKEMPNKIELEHLTESLMVVKVGSDDRPATMQDIEDTKKVVKNLEIPNLKWWVTHHNIDLKLFVGKNTNDPLIGKVGRCSNGRPGHILDRRELPCGMSYVGIGLDNGSPWASRKPEIIADSIDSYYSEAGYEWNQHAACSTLD